MRKWLLLMSRHGKEEVWTLHDADQTEIDRFGDWWELDKCIIAITQDKVETTFESVEKVISYIKCNPDWHFVELVEID